MQPIRLARLCGRTRYNFAGWRWWQQWQAVPLVMAPNERNERNERNFIEFSTFFHLGAQNMESNSFRERVREIRKMQARRRALDAKRPRAAPTGSECALLRLA
jgi:hypothetical protein